MHFWKGVEKFLAYANKSEWKVLGLRNPVWCRNEGLASNCTVPNQGQEWSQIISWWGCFTAFPYYVVFQSTWKNIAILLHLQSKKVLNDHVGLTARKGSDWKCFWHKGFIFYAFLNCAAYSHLYLSSRFKNCFMWRYVMTSKMRQSRT